MKRLLVIASLVASMLGFGVIAAPSAFASTSCTTYGYTSYPYRGSGSSFLSGSSAGSCQNIGSSSLIYHVVVRANLQYWTGSAWATIATRTGGRYYVSSGSYVGCGSSGTSVCVAGITCSSPYTNYYWRTVGQIWAYNSAGTLLARNAYATGYKLITC